MTVVDLSYGDFNIKSLALAVADPANVSSLDLSGNSIDAPLLAEIINNYIVHMTNLKELDLKNNKIGPQGAEQLLKTIMQYCPNLRYLDLNENGIFDESVLHVAYLLQETCVEKLFLVSNHLTLRSVPTLCDGLISSQHIRDLSLAFNALGDKGASMLAKALNGHHSLRLLDISDNRIGDAGAVDVAEHLILSPDSRLESLNLSVNCIGDVGFAAIAEALAQTRSTRLVHLDLGGNSSVGSTGREALINCVGSMAHLRSLDVSSCGLSDGDARGLVVALLRDTCGIVSMEWFNNPEMLPSTEKMLEDALEKKAAFLREGECWRQVGFFFGAAILIAVLFTLKRMRQR